jgi:hypothetical protein
MSNMDKTMETEYWVPEHVREYLRSLGFVLPLEAMEGYIRMWHEWMQSVGSFYDYRDTDGFGRIYEVHRRSIHPAMRVCQEWGSLLLNDKTSVVCENQAATEWLDDFFTKTGFMPQAQNTVVRAFGMGTGAWALWIDADARKVRIRHYDARMVIPLTWDEEGVSECAFVTRAFYRGKAVDQLQMHLRGGLGLDGNFSSPSQPESPDASSPSESSLSRGNQASPSQSFPSQNCGGTYKIVTAIFDEDGNLVEPSGVCTEYDTGSPFPTFSIVKPAVDNTLNTCTRSSRLYQVSLRCSFRIGLHLCPCTLSRVDLT